MAIPRTALLTLETLTPDQVRIDGQAYDLLTSAQLSILDHARLQRHSARFDALMAREATLTDEEAVELAQIADAICRVVLRAPTEVQAKLTDIQRVEICLTFMLLSLGKWLTSESMAAPATLTPTSPLIGASKRRASRASSAESRPRG